MSRFNTEKYDPRTDSSAGTDQHRAASRTERGVILVTPEGKCLDGCGAEIGKGKRFVQGHDARLKGILIRAHLAGAPVTTWNGKTNVKTASAVEFAKTLSTDKFDWVEMLEKSKAAHDTPRPARKRPAKKVAAKKAPAKKAPAKKPAAKKTPAKKAAKRPAKKAAPMAELQALLP